MKKLIILIIALIMVISMTIPVGAVTPALKVPDMPNTSDIKIDISVGSDEDANVKLSNDFWDRWFTEHPINIKIPIRFNFDR